MYEINLTESTFPAQADENIYEITIGDLLRDVASRHPSAPAVTEIDIDGESGITWTYKQLLAESEKLALRLSSRFQPGERIVVWAPNIPEWLLMEYACALAGIVLVTANPSFQAPELRYVLEQSGSVALFLIDSYRRNPMSAIASHATKDLAQIREIVQLKDKEALYRIGAIKPQLAEVSPTDAAQIQYTSGTTGFPKGAILSHRGLVNNARFFANRAQTRKDSVWANFMPLFHTAGCATAALGSLQAACKMLLLKSFDPIVLIQVIEREKVTVFYAVPTMLVALLEAIQQRPLNMTSVEVITSGSAPVSPDLARNVQSTFSCALLTAFGQTEASPMISLNYKGGLLDDICHSAGQPLPQTDVSVRGIEDSKVLPVQTVGEICARGYCTMIGYNDNETATKKSLDNLGWLHTGDLGKMDSRGFIYVTGRIKDMIIRGGENYYPAEIENLLLKHSAVAEVAVVGLPDNKWGEIISCFIRSEGNRELEIQDLRRFCREYLSPQKTPSVWCKVDAFPLTASGKVQKFVLRDKYIAGEYH